jgi:hypothetical protein
MAREPASWVDLIHKAVHTSDDQNIGNIEAVSPNFAVVKRGLVHVRRYYIPLGKVEGWDGRVVWLKIPEEQVRRDYERQVAPDPFVYHYSSEPLADGSVRDFSINMPVIEPPNEEEEKKNSPVHQPRHQMKNGLGSCAISAEWLSEAKKNWVTMSLQNIRRAIIKAQKLLFMQYFFFMPILRAPFTYLRSTPNKLLIWN